MQCLSSLGVFLLQIQHNFSRGFGGGGGEGGWGGVTSLSTDISESESIESTAMHDGPSFGSAAGDTFGFMTVLLSFY